MKWFILLLLASLKEEKKIQQRGGWGKSPNFLYKKPSVSQKPRCNSKWEIVLPLEGAVA